MRESWLSSYSKASHTVLQHWFEVSSRNRQNLSHPSTKCLRKSRSRGLKTCLGFKNDSMASVLDYIASVNTSASQLSHVQPMTVQDVYDLVTLMGFYLSEASGHAYIDTFSHPDAGHALMRDVAKYPEDPPSDDDSA
jgi:hypothetical protein